MTGTAKPQTMTMLALTLLISLSLAEDDFVHREPSRDSPSIFFAESFPSEDALGRFLPSTASKEGVEEEIAKYDGRWEVAPVDAAGLQGDLALIMKDKAKHHAIAAQLDKTFRPSATKPLVFQYEVKFQTEHTCGGAYVKLLSQDQKTDFAKFHDKTPYTIMFGPDRCGTQEKLHLILRHVNPVTNEVEEKHAKKPADFDKTYFEPGKTRLYRLTMFPDSSFEISVDRNVLSKGHLLSDMTPSLIPEETIEDPEDSKPEDWDDREKIPDPEASKPEDWDESAPKQIEDPEAVKPEGWLDDAEPMVADSTAERPLDWDDEMDGEWEAPLVENPKCQGAPGCGVWTPPMIDNPAYKGKWRPPLIENVAYKGVWKPRRIKNPAYFEETNPFERVTPIAAVGLELWTMSNDVAFDNFILADDITVVDRWTEETWDRKTKKEGASAPSGPTFLHQLFDAANERPWLWVVYCLALLVPICILTMVFCPVKKEKEGDSHQDKYDAVGEEAEETKEEEAIRKKTDAPVPDVIEEEEAPQESEPATEVEEPSEMPATPPKGAITPPKEAKTPPRQKPTEQDEVSPVNGMTNGMTNGISNGYHDEDIKSPMSKSVLNGYDEDEILRRSPRIKNKVRPRRE